MSHMTLAPAAEANEILRKFGHKDTKAAWDKMRLSRRDKIRFTVPPNALKQAAISEVLVDRLCADIVDGAPKAAVLWLEDWSIFYAYQLRLFWSNLGFELEEGERPEYSLSYWPSVDAATRNKIKAAYFIMMAFEFSGCILMQGPESAICVDDGEIIVVGGDESIRREMAVLLDHTVSPGQSGF